MTHPVEKTFVPHAETMDLRPLYDKLFIVAVSTGARDDGRLLAKTIHGPYEFDEMIGEVNRMWAEEQNNAKVYILEKNPKIKSRWLDSNTIDYIQIRCADIIVDKILSKDQEYTCEVGLLDKEKEQA